MASENNNFQSTVNSLFKGMDSFITTKTVVGDAITVGDTIILPLVDVTFGVAATAKNEDKKQNGGGGMGGKMSPSAVLVIQNGTTKLVNVKNQDGLTKILDMVPDFVNKFTDGKFFSSKDDDEIISEAKEEKETVKIPEEPVKTVTEAAVTTPVEATPVKPIDVTFTSMDDEPKEKEEPKAMVQIEAEDKVAKNEDLVPTLDSLLQDLNMNNKEKKTDDPFEFLGSVDF